VRRRIYSGPPVPIGGKRTFWAPGYRCTPGELARDISLSASTAAAASNI